MLTDLEFRTWIQYLLSADDFGVMRASSVSLQADNDALHAKRPKIIQACLEAVINSGLLLEFQHQSRRYVCQWDWQDYQHVGYPRSTVNPSPPAEVLAKCSPKTRDLFARHLANISQMVPKPLANDSATIPEVFDKSFTPSRAREEAKANGSCSSGVEKGSGGKPARPASSLEPEDIAERAARLVERFAALYRQHRHGARYHARPTLDWQEACDLCRTWESDAHLDKLAELVLTTDEKYIAGTDRGFHIFAIKASWADDRLKQWEASQEIRP